MRRRVGRNWVAALLLIAVTLGARADGAPSVERGREALFTRSFSKSLMKRESYEVLWKQWGLKERPADFESQVRERYGLFEAPYPNGGLPMGLRPTERDGVRAVGIDCMLCHGGAVFGKSIVGLPNSSIDLAALFRDLDKADGGLGLFPYRMSNVRGTTEATATGIFLMSLRDAELGRRLPLLSMYPIPDQLCEDAPAWWLLKRKKTMYHNGQIDAHAIRPLMTFMLAGNERAVFDRNEATFRDIREYLGTLEPPKYPLPIDSSLAADGREVFSENCAKCHGTYGAERRYPNKIVDVAEIGTDSTLVKRLTPAIESHFRESWFTKETRDDGKPLSLRYNGGYQAPPLDGVWATAPYLHNGSVPTLRALLNSSERPKRFTRSFGTTVDDFDAQRVGWKTMEVAESSADAGDAARRVYDTTQTGRSNAGHAFGDDLTEPQRRAVIEYLKTL